MAAGPTSRGARLLRTLAIIVAFALGIVAVWLIVTGDTKQTKVGVLVGLWGLLIAAYPMLGARNQHPIVDPDAEPGAPSTALEARSVVQERRIYEQRLEAALRRQIHASVSAEMSSLKSEISALRSELVEKVGGQLRLERIETTRLIGSDLEAMKEEVRQLADRPSTTSTRTIEAVASAGRAATRSDSFTERGHDETRRDPFDDVFATRGESEARGEPDPRPRTAPFGGRERRDEPVRPVGESRDPARDAAPMFVPPPARPAYAAQSGSTPGTAAARPAPAAAAARPAPGPDVSPAPAADVRTGPRGPQSQPVAGFGTPSVFGGPAPTQTPTPAGRREAADPLGASGRPAPSNRPPESPRPAEPVRPPEPVQPAATGDVPSSRGSRPDPPRPAERTAPPAPAAPWARAPEPSRAPEPTRAPPVAAPIHDRTAPERTRTAEELRTAAVASGPAQTAHPDRPADPFADLPRLTPWRDDSAQQDRSSSRAGAPAAARSANRDTSSVPNSPVAPGRTRHAAASDARPAAASAPSAPTIPGATDPGTDTHSRHSRPEDDGETTPRTGGRRYREEGGSDLLSRILERERG